MTLTSGTRSADELQLRRDLRIASPSIFPVYFQFSVPGDSISSADVKAYLSVAADAQAFTRVLRDLIDQHNERIHLFLERLQDYKDAEPIRSNASSVIEALLNVGDIFTSLGELQLGRLIIGLLTRTEERKRFEILEAAIRTGRSISGVTGIVAVLGMGFGKFGETRPYPAHMQYITPAQLPTLEQLALARIHEAITENSLQDVPNLSGIIVAWRDWAGDVEPAHWLAQLIETDEGMLRLLRRSMQLQRDTDRPIRFLYERYDLLDLAGIARRLNVLVENHQLSTDDTILAAEFLKYYRGDASPNM